MSEVHYLSGGIELLDVVAPLWVKNAQHHAKVSKHFSHPTDTPRFRERRTSLEEHARLGRLRVDLARLSDGGDWVGYCISTISDQGLGEIQSFFVDEAHRCKGIGTGLLERTLAWMDASGATRKRAYTVVGNERVHTLYGRFGFLPKTVILEQQSSSPGNVRPPERSEGTEHDTEVDPR